MEEKPIKEIISGNIKRLINEKKIKQKEFAKKIDMSESSISNYIKGVNLFPLEKIVVIAKFFKCTVNDLFSPLFDKVIIEEGLKEILNKVRNVWELEENRKSLEEQLSILEKRLKEKKEEKRG